MRSLTIFNTQSNKDRILSNIKFDNAQQHNNTFVVSNVLKLDFSNGLRCYCYDLYITEQILSAVLKIENNNNNVSLTFPKDFDSIILECDIYDFNKIVELSVNKDVSYININLQEIRFFIYQNYLTMDINVRYNKAIIKITLKEYNTTVDDVSLFFKRIRQHPLSYVESLREYFDFGNYEFKPELEYLYYYKMLKSDTGYKKYANFMNSTDIDFEYSNKEYTAKLKKGKIEFRLNEISDKYPKKIIFQTESEEDLIYITQLQKYFNINQISIIAKVKNLKLDILQLRKLDFNKEEDFFIFSNVKDKFKASYDIFDNSLTVRQDFNEIEDANKDYIIEFINMVGGVNVKNR